MTVLLEKNLNADISDFSNAKPVCILVPPSKSMSHRALIAASLASGYSELQNIAKNDDTSATIKCLRQLGAQIEETANFVSVKGIENFSAYNGSIIECKESASTLRMLIPLFAQSGKTCTFTGGQRLMQRPLGFYEELFNINKIIGGNSQNVMGLRASGALKPGIFSIQGNVSSQFISGLLFALPLLEADSVIDIYPPFESESYVRMTIDMLRLCGIKIDIVSAKDFSMLGNFQKNAKIGRTIIKVPGNQKYNTFSYKAEGDWSAAAFWVEYSLVSGKTIAISGLNPDSIQGDKAIMTFAEQFGAQTAFQKDADKDVLTVKPAAIRPINADISDCPDLGPALFAIASCAKGTSVFTGTARLSLKESDRNLAMKQGLEKLGCRMEVKENSVVIFGKESLRGRAVLDAHNDHRIAMALSMLCLKADGQIAIHDASCVNKSYPGFFEELSGPDCYVKFL